MYYLTELRPIVRKEMLRNMQGQVLALVLHSMIFPKTFRNTLGVRQVVKIAPELFNTFRQPISDRGLNFTCRD